METRNPPRKLDHIIAIARKTNRHKKTKELDERDIFCRVQDAFRISARKTSAVLGTAWAFMGAVAVIVIWGLTGHVFHYSDTWQLIINTSTTIVTFLMVFSSRTPRIALPAPSSLSSMN